MMKDGPCDWPWDLVELKEENVPQILEAYRKIYEAGVYPILLDALGVCDQKNHRYPKWLCEALKELLEGVLRGELGLSPRKMHPGVKAYKDWFRKYDQYHAVAEAKLFQDVNARSAEVQGISIEEAEKEGPFIGVGVTRQDAIEFANKRYRSSISNVGEETYKWAYGKLRSIRERSNSLPELGVSFRSRKLMGLRAGRFLFPKIPRKRK